MNSIFLLIGILTSGVFMKIVIVGCGIAGFTAAKRLRELDPRAEISVIDREGHGLYSRMRLPETLAGTLPETKLILSSAAAMKSLGIAIFSGISALSFDSEKKTVTLSNGTVLPYDKLILALGATASLPPIEGAQPSMLLRSLEDLERLVAAAEKAKTATVIGGGLLGLENAHALLVRGIRVAIVECMPRLLPKQLTEAESKLLQEKFTEAGYQLCLGRKTLSIHTESGLAVVTLDDGTVLRSDMVIISAGISPVTDLAKAAGATVERGIVVNSRFETTLNDVYAIGDCAQIGGVSSGLWIASKDQGAALAEILCGNKNSFELPVYQPSLKIPGIKLNEIRTAAQNK